jgi:hypothetical protein
MKMSPGYFHVSIKSDDEPGRLGAKLAKIIWLFVIFDTDGEVPFAGVSGSANQRVERALNGDKG